MYDENKIVIEGVLFVTEFVYQKKKILDLLLGEGRFGSDIDRAVPCKLFESRKERVLKLTDLIHRTHLGQITLCDNVVRNLMKSFKSEIQNYN